MANPVPPPITENGKGRALFLKGLGQFVITFVVALGLYIVGLQIYDIPSLLPQRILDNFNSQVMSDEGVNLVENGGFDDTPVYFEPWIVQNESFAGIDVDVFPKDGRNNLFIWNKNSFWQDTKAIAGEVYALTFYAMAIESTSQNISVQFGNLSTQISISPGDPTNGPYHLTSLTAKANGNDQLRFQLLQTSTIRFDNISIYSNPINVTPSTTFFTSSMTNIPLYTSQPQKRSSSTNVGAIAGGAVAAVIVVVLVVSIFYYHVRRKRQRRMMFGVELDEKYKPAPVLSPPPLLQPLTTPPLSPDSHFHRVSIDDSPRHGHGVTTFYSPSGSQVMTKDDLTQPDVYEEWKLA